MDPNYNKQNNNKQTFIKVNDNIVISENYIRWIKKIDECLKICNKPGGCYDTDVHTVCKVYNPDSYNKLNKYFE